jgi:hypothetical protein
MSLHSMCALSVKSPTERGCVLINEEPGITFLSFLVFVVCNLFS